MEPPLWSATKHDPATSVSPAPDKNAKLVRGPFGIRSISLTGLFILACFYTLYFARDFFLPVMVAIIFNFLLGPVVRALRGFRIPSPIGSAVVIASFLAVFSLLSFQLAGPLAEWLSRVPETGARLQAKIEPLKKSVEKVATTSEQVERLMTLRAERRKALQSVELKQTSLLDVLFSGTSKAVFSVLVFIVLLYFLMASGDLFLSKLVHVLPKLSDKKRAVQIAREIEGNISRYLLTLAAINFTIGILSTLIFWLFGMPNPALWGAISGLLSFIPTVGSVGAAILVTLVAAAAFPSIAQALLVPASFLAMTITMGTFVSPHIMGRRLLLNPVVIFLCLSFWGWMWGIPGALLAVPMLAMFKIICDHIEPLSPLGEFLGQ